jgi:aminomethyltransferase
MIDRAIPRPGYRVKIDNQDIGYVTSGTQSPSLEKGIGLAYVDNPHTKSGTEVIVEVRGKSKQAIIVKPPFYKNGTVLI